MDITKLLANIASQNINVKKDTMSTKGFPTRTNRAALGDIGNKVSNMTIDPTKKSGIIKKEILQKSKFVKKEQELETIQDKEPVVVELIPSLKMPTEPIVTVDPMDISEDKPEAFSKAMCP
ncbi:hypothetical protein LOTGIDRAFT_176443, partial [Lottia gigantea]